MGKYKYFKIKTIKDEDGEDWDVYEEQKSSTGIMIYQGWPYALTPRDGIGGTFSFILTPEIAEFIKIHSITETMQQLGLSNGIVAKFRRRLNIQNKVIYRNDQWLLEHQDELLHDSFETLKSKYGLNRNQVYRHKEWLSKLIEIPIGEKIRKNPSDELRERWFVENKLKMLHLSVQEIAIEYNISLYIAKKAYNRIRDELGELNFSDEFKNSKQIQHQWLLDHQDQLLNHSKSIAELAVHFQKTEGQIRRARAKLREILKMPKVKDQNQTWLFANHNILLDLTLSKEEAAKKLNIEPSQVYRKRGALKKLLNIPHHNDVVQAWRLDNQEVLLSLHLTIPEIAKILDRSEKYIVKNRMILRNFLGITKQDQKNEWVLDHRHDLETLSIEKLQEEYNIGPHVVKSYKKLLIELKQNENE
ncbi:hypothetical protein M2R48_12120 [Acinetobacter sp. I-MWF]|uniref:hypothetical protein n=1 Tax=Acinetobacter TaxID=469 RepID=UPI0021C77073|nr:hypothetical protein [Acinetobacter sp. I-MWF]MCT9979079.1 hypothetical protein [Acinetobacter sp. I-MWF]